MQVRAIPASSCWSTRYDRRASPAPVRRRTSWPASGTPMSRSTSSGLPCWAVICNCPSGDRRHQRSQRHPLLGSRHRVRSVGPLPTPLAVGSRASLGCVLPVRPKRHMDRPARTGHRLGLYDHPTSRRPGHRIGPDSQMTENEAEPDGFVRFCFISRRADDGNRTHIISLEG